MTKYLAESAKVHLWLCIAANTCTKTELVSHLGSERMAQLRHGLDGCPAEAEAVSKGCQNGAYLIEWLSQRCQHSKLSPELVVFNLLDKCLLTSAF